jgi:hypothetical protein
MWRKKKINDFLNNFDLAESMAAGLIILFGTQGRRLLEGARTFGDGVVRREEVDGKTMRRRMLVNRYP